MIMLNKNKIQFKKIVRVGQRSLLYSDLFCVSWLLGRFCNYKCEYCWPHGRSNKKDHRPTEIIIKTLNEIKKQAREYGFNSFHFSFSGGEPTLHPGYLKIIEHYCADIKNTNYQSLHMTTNLSPGSKWFKKYVDLTKGVHRVSVTASWHREFASRDKFAEKLIYCRDNDINIIINIVMRPQIFDDLYEDAEFFYNQGLNVTLKPQSDPTASFVIEGYTDDMKKKMKTGFPHFKAPNTGKRPKRKEDQEFNENMKIFPEMQVELLDEDGQKQYLDQAERFNAFGFNKFKNWECSAGFRSIIIREPDGSIKRGYSCHDKPLGFIGEDFKLFNGPQKCITPTCVSSADSKIPKRKPGNNFSLWHNNKNDL